MKRLIVLFTAFNILFLNEALSANLEKGLIALDAGDFKTALEEIVPLAKSGDAKAQSKLGSMYAIGHGLPVNIEEAVRWYTLSANQGHLMSQYLLGAIYYKGIGSVKKNGSKAISLFRRAAESGLPVAQVQLGTHYLTGKFVPKDYIESYKWTTLGASAAKILEDKSTFERGEKIIDLLRKRMNQEQIEEGYRRAMEIAK